MESGNPVEYGEELAIVAEPVELPAKDADGESEA